MQMSGVITVTLAVTVIFLFGSVLFGQQKNHAPQFFRLTMKKG